MISPSQASTPLHACGVDDGVGSQSQSCSTCGSLQSNATGSLLVSSEAQEAVPNCLSSLGLWRRRIERVEVPVQVRPVTAEVIAPQAVFIDSLRDDERCDNQPGKGNVTTLAV
jgi:hypothetical protein